MYRGGKGGSRVQHNELQHGAYSELISSAPAVRRKQSVREGPKMTETPPTSPNHLLGGSRSYGVAVGFLGYSPLRPAGRASPARRAPRRVLGGQEDRGSPVHPVRPRPPRGRGSRARPGRLAARGWRGSGVLSWVRVGFRLTAGSTEDNGVGMRVPWGCSAAGCGALLAPSSRSLTCPFGPGSPDSPWGQRMQDYGEAAL